MITAPMAPMQLLQKYRPQPQGNLEGLPQGVNNWMPTGRALGAMGAQQMQPMPPQFRPMPPAQIGGALGNNFDPGWKQNIPQPQNMPMPQQVKNRMAQGMADAIGGTFGGYNPQGAAGGAVKRMGGMNSQKGLMSSIFENRAQVRQNLRRG